MSFIYAHKFNNSIKILSDTKPTINGSDIMRLETRFPRQEYLNFLKYGFIKTVIYKPNITISSAGDVEHFNEFLGFLNKNNINDVKDITSEAFKFNLKYNGDTDFIITTDKDIYEITEKGIKNVSSSWIGDIDAFIEFKKFQENNVPSEISYIGDASEDMRRIDKEMISIDNAFKSLIDNTKISTVGGFVVRCIYENGKYIFLAPYVLESGEVQQSVKLGDAINFNSNSIAEGGFEFIPLDDCYFCGYIKQIDKYIVYKPGYTDENYMFLSMPYLIGNNE